jgi:two-component system, response regulator FlrC
MIGVSMAVAEVNPGLAAWLAGAGLPCTTFDPAASWHTGAAIRGPAEFDAARPSDVLLAIASGEPALVRESGAPAIIHCTADDLPFANALAAEMLRPTARPASGYPESARTLEFAARVAASDASVLVLGETGTGKEGMARYIHSISSRANGSFTAVNCAALPETMLEAILFGHRKGSFTGASQDGEGLFRAAHGGTLLLDEISEVPLALQAKLLRALQEREVLPVGAVRPESVDVRIIACANRDLAEEVSAGRFRADLYWRLNVVPLHLQPLRARRRDVLAIAAALFLRHCPPETALPFPTQAALDRLVAHDWPGNCRELDNVIQRALLLRSGPRIEPNDLVIDEAAPTVPADNRPISLNAAARSAEARAIRAALAEVGGHRIRAAERLGISERTLRYRLAEMRAVAA